MYYRFAALLFFFLSAFAFAAGESDAEAAAAAKLLPKTSYFELTPKFVVNIKSRDSSFHYLLVEVQIMSLNQQGVEDVQMHNDKIRNDLLTLFSDQAREQLETVGGRVVLQEQSLEVIKKALQDEQADPKNIAKVLFTQFVIE